MTLSHVWAFLCLSAAASAVTVLYPSIGGSESLTCECPDHQCQKVYWYRLLRDNDTLQFLLYCNSANTAEHAAGIDKSRFKATANEGSKIVYTLRVSGLQKGDAGHYSCILDSPKHDEKTRMPAGYYIRPGEQRPTSRPPTVKKPKTTKPRTCESNNQPVKGCKPLVLWSSVGVLLFLAVVLISTLYYFSRLPKKCRHRFTNTEKLSSVSSETERRR